jgi:hypothetical protein
MPLRGPTCTLGYQRAFNLILWVLYTGLPWKGWPGPTEREGKADIHDTTVDNVFATWADDWSIRHALVASVGHLSEHNPLDLSILHGDGTNTVAQTGGDGLGDAGHKHQKGEKVIAIMDTNGDVLAPLPVAPVNEADTVLLPEGLQALKRVARLTGVGLTGASLNFDGGCDSRHHRKAIFNAGLLPNVQENPRHRNTTQRGRKRLCHDAMPA